MLKLSLGTTFEQLSCQTSKVVFTLGMAQEEDIWGKRTQGLCVGM